MATFSGREATTASVSSFLNNPATQVPLPTAELAGKSLKNTGKNAGHQPAAEPVAILRARQVPDLHLVGNVR